MQRKLSITEVQTVALEILKKITDICEKNGLRYFLAYGTLIGAVRHQGFIPWDDDVDIMMPCKDYEKLCKYFVDNANNLLPLQMMNDETVQDYPYMIARVSDSRYKLSVVNEKSYGIGIFIDIFPLYGLGNDFDTAKRIIYKGKRLSSLIFLSTRCYFHKGMTKSLLKTVVKLPAFIYAKLCGQKYFVDRSLKLIGKYNYDESEYVGCTVWPVYRDFYEKSLLTESIYIPFEKYQFRVPREYKKILTQLYGDYMQFPPEKERIAHHLYTAYLKDDAE